MSLCLAAGALAATLSAHAFTLAWIHSIEKVRWEEDWRVEGARLVLVAARIRGAGAGMEPPAGAVFDRGVWHYRPAQAEHERLLVGHSPHAAGYELCAAGRCRSLAEHLPGLPRYARVEIYPCDPAAPVPAGGAPER